KTIQVGNTTTDTCTCTQTDIHGATTTNAVTAHVAIDDAGPVANAATVSTTEDAATPLTGTVSFSSEETLEPGGHVAVTAMNGSKIGRGSGRERAWGATRAVAADDSCSCNSSATTT